MSDGLARARRVLRERGLRGVALGSVGELHARLEFSRRRRRKPQTFVVDGVEHNQLLHLHNRTWRNERAVEIPLAIAFLDRQPGLVLELGNVLANYGRRGHRVVDKYEERPGVINVDMVEYRPVERFDAIVSVSTLEHVGWDEEPRDPAKIPQAIKHLRRLLSPTGRLFVTCPISHNPYLDALIAEGTSGADREAFLMRDRDDWRQADRGEAYSQARMGRYGGTAIWVAEFPP